MQAALLAVTIGLAAACHRGAVAPHAGGSAASATTASAQTVRMLLVNDVYVIDTLRDGSGGLARVAGLRDSIERVTGSKVLFVLAGDVLSPSVLGKWYLGAQMVDAFNAARLDYATLGNHEFDISRAMLGARLQESRFRWLSGNCHDANGAPFPGVRGWDTLRVNGVKVGLFGTTVVRDYPSYVRCANADSVTTRLVDTLAAQGSDLVVGLTHRYLFEDTRTLETEPRVHAILGGHEHDGKRVVVNGRVVVKAMSNARTAVLVTFTRGRNGWTSRDEIVPIDRRLPQAPATRAVVARWRDTLERRIGPDRVLGVTPEPINALDSTSRKGESRFGDLIVDAMRAGTKADVALINSGALRFDDIIAAGPVTRHMIEGVFVFADETRVVTFPLSGSRLRAVLETGVRQGGLGDGPYPQVSGVHFRVDGTRPSGSRIVGDLHRDDGRVIAPSDTVTVTFVTYPACRGGDGYAIPEASAACAAVTARPEAAPRTVDLVMQHLEQMGGRIVVPALGRVERVDKR